MIAFHSIHIWNSPEGILGLRPEAQISAVFGTTITPGFRGGLWNGSTTSTSRPRHHSQGTAVSRRFHSQVEEWNLWRQKSDKRNSATQMRREKLDEKKGASTPPLAPPISGTSGASTSSADDCVAVGADHKGLRDEVAFHDMLWPWDRYWMQRSSRCSYLAGRRAARTDERMISLFCGANTV